MVNYTEDDIVEAIFDYIDRGISLRKAATQRRIPRSILQGRINGVKIKID